MKTYILLLLSLIALNPVWGQVETIEAGDPAPFSGEIHYALSWKGPNTALWANHLPDSLVLGIGSDGIRARYFGGVSDSLIHEYLWLKDENSFYLLDAKHMIAFTNPPGLKQEKHGFTPLNGETASSTLLEHSCKAYQSKIEDVSDTYWMTEDIYYPHSMEDSLGGFPAFLGGEAQTIPLKMERRTPDGVVVTTTAVKMTTQAQPALLEALQGYVQKPFSVHTGRHPYFGPKQK